MDPLDPDPGGQLVMDPLDPDPQPLILTLLH
jgi:hypothetical protein